ncbi:bridge-like lipid transfer protein family member hobbit isoform X2 [Leptinotarsa decemlineata]|uniref:bridge-like lipid transfer protein family member hobbit isoform X2 n=1 Tax=Leptinotarsa decemlineata TaxID=7539 RepID=UPI003D30778C
MGGFIIFLIIICVLFLTVSWILPMIISWHFQRKYDVSLKIKKIGMPYLKLCDISLSKNGFSIHVDEISIKSSFLNSELTKLVTLVVRDVRINKDLSSKNVDESTKYSPQTKSDIDFRDNKVPHFITSFAQFMAVHVYNISAMLLRSETPGYLIHATASELHLDGSILKNAKSLLATINLMDAEMKILRHAEQEVKETKLAEFSFGISMETILVAQGPLSVEKLDINMSHSRAVINGGFYNLAQSSKSEKIPKMSRYNSSSCEDDIFERLKPIIPKKCSLYIDETSLTGVKDNSQIEYSSSLKSLALNCRSVPIDDKMVSEDSSVLFNFYMSDLFLQNSKEKLLELKHLNIDAKSIQNSLNIYLQQNCLLLTYDHNLIYKWVSTNFPRSHQEISPMILEDTEKRRDRLRIYRSSAFEKIIEKLNISFCAELFQVLAVIRLKNQDSSIGFNRVRLMLDQSPEKRGSTFKAYIPNLFLRDRHWAMEFSVDSLWWSFKEWNQDTNVSKVTHIWGTPLYLGMGVIKLSTSANQEVRLESLLDTIQLEWSLEFADYVLLALRCFKQYGSIKPKQSSPKKEIGDRDLQNVSCHLVVTHFNFFMQAQNREYFVSRMNTISLDKTIDEVRKSANAVNVKFEGFKIFSLNSNGDGYTCIQTEDISNYKVFINTALLEVRNLEEKPKETTLTLLETVETHWSTNFHLKSLLLVRDVMEFLSGVKKELDIVDGGAVKQKCFNTLNIFGKFEFHIEISPSHNAKIALEELSVTKKIEDIHLPSDISINTSLLISIDEQKIFTLKGIDVHRIKSHPVIEAERNDAGSFNLKFNKTYGIFIDLFTAVFPHEHNFAEAIQNQLVSVFKWLKIIHNIKKDKTSQQSLPGDLLINVKEFLFEMSDDPFEVKLRDNFELLEDEYNESLKRQKMLRDKIGDLLKTHLHMPAGKVEELYATLKKKNAEIYVQRSKLMYKASPQRTRLFAWSMANLELLILADPSIHGPEKVINVMREIDSASPWPEEPMEFSTLWCRVISFRCAEWKFQLRDFPQPLMHIKKCYICGQLVGAEQVAPKRAIRTVEVHLGEPFEPVVIERGMLPLKFYHDFNCEVEYFSYAFGPCWEPVIAQCNLSFNQISAPSRDPSPVLTFWDKMRLLLHGRLTMVVEQLTVLLHASLDPYNTTEEMALTWEKVIMDWTNAKFVYKGDLNIFVRTASKYDDVQLLKMPNLKLILGINWVCLGHPNDHHSVIQCAPDKVPEYSSNQVHDSFRAFRSQNVNLSIVLETRPVPNEPNNCPILLLYGSTLRWIESLKLILSGVTRPTKRGRIFNNVRPRKIQLSRHYKKVHLLIGLHKFQVCYWMSFSMQRGSELFGGRLSSSSEHTLSLVNIDDGLKHRPKAEWSVVYMNSELSDFEMWLKSALHDEQDVEVPTPRQPVEKCFCLSVAKVSYGRETVVPSQERNKDIPTHRLVVHDLRGAWTKSNRNVAFALFDTFMKTTRLKKNLSTEALKGFRKENATTPLKRRNTDPSCTPPNASIQAIQSSTAVQDTPSPMTKLQSGHAANMLQQLIAEADNNAVVYSDDLSAVSKQHLQGLQACQQDDVQHKNWQIALVNAQVLLKGCETKGYVILSAAKAEIVQRIHRPAWKDRTLVSKTTWLGTLECMQYYATVNARENDTTDDNIMWLTVDNIQEKESTEISEPSEVPNMVGSGVSVGAVVSDTVGPSCSRQLQRIVSRCKCEFFYADYGDISVDPKGLGEIPPPPQEEVGPWESRESAVDAFTLMHYDLEVCTNSLQYAMLLDIVNNLLLYVEPHRKEALEKLARMRFKLQLHSVEDQRKPIQNQQTLVRSTQSKLKRLEKETYLVNKALEESPDDIGLRQDAGRLERLMDECKNQLSAQSEELDMMLSCYKESQLLANARLATTRSDKPLTIVRANEICFKHAQWRLTEADGQIGIADLVLSNFLYTKNSKSDDSVEHLLELGYMRMTNLLPNEIYKEVLCPTEIQFDMPIEHKKVLRIFCREKPPVGGISVKEIFEINLVPLTLGLTKKFYSTMMKFCFSERESENNDYNDRTSEDGDADQKGKKSKLKRNRDSNFYVHIDDVEKMKERAEKNKLFVYIKIPEVPVKVSYKGTKEKNLEDLRDYSIIIPTLEYHNMTWTWLDFLMAIRNDSKRVILSQAIKQKLQIKRNTGSSNESTTPQEEDKARMLFGARHAPENRSIRKGVSGVFRFGNRKQEQ